MRINKRLGWLLCASATLGLGPALNAAPIVVVDDDFEQETLGDQSNQLDNWVGQGTIANGVIIDADPGAGVNKAFQMGQSAAIFASNLDLSAGGGVDPVVLSIKFDFTDVSAGNDWFGLFWRDGGGGNPVYRVQWNAGANGNGGIIIKKTNSQLAVIGGLPVGFWDGTTHEIEMVITFEAGTDSAVGTNTLELFVDGDLKATDHDIAGITDDGTGITRRLLPTAVSSLQISNFNAEASALNVLDNVSISSIPEPATLALLGLGSMMMVSRRISGH